MTPPWGEEWYREVRLAHRFIDEWAVMRDLLPDDADVPLLLAARDAAFWVLDRIMQAERRDGLSKTAKWLLELARMSAIGRIAMLDNWRLHLTGATFTPRRPYGEDTSYARVMRMPPSMLARVIWVVGGEKPGHEPPPYLGAVTAAMIDEAGNEPDE